MKHLLILMSLSLSPAAFAQGSFLMAPEEPKAAAPARPPANTGITPPAPIARRTPNPTEVASRPPVTAPARLPEPASPRKPTIADSCTSNFNEAAKLFKAVHDVELSRLGSFGGTFKSYRAVNTLRRSGSSLSLNLKINTGNIFVGTINVDLPVTICKKGNKLTATLLVSKATDPSTGQRHEMLASAEVDSIALNVTRQGNALSFNGSTNGTALSATAGVR